MNKKTAKKAGKLVEEIEYQQKCISSVEKITERYYSEEQEFSIIETFGVCTGEDIRDYIFSFDEEDDSGLMNEITKTILSYYENRKDKLEKELSELA